MQSTSPKLEHSSPIAMSSRIMVDTTRTLLIQYSSSSTSYRLPSGRWRLWFSTTFYPITLAKVCYAVQFLYCHPFRQVCTCTCTSCLQSALCVSNSPSPYLYLRNFSCFFSDTKHIVDFDPIFLKS